VCVSGCITVKYEYAPLTYQNKKNDLYLHVFALPILLSLQSNDKYSENNHPSQCRITVTLHRLSGALLSICALRSTLNVFFFSLSHPALISTCSPEQDSAEVRERSSAYEWEEKTVSYFYITEKEQRCIHLCATI